MRQPVQQTLLMIAPLAVAAAVGLGSPWLEARQAAGEPSATDRYDRTLANACEASHRAQAVPPAHGKAEGRTQSPAWQQEHSAAVEQCLRDGLRVIREARAGG